MITDRVESTSVNSPPTSSVSARMIGVQHPAGLVVCLIILFIFYYAYFFLGACMCMQLLWHTCGSQDSVQILEGNLLLPSESQGLN